MLEHYFVHGCTLYTQTPDEYNDLRITNSTVTSCHFRDGRTLDSNLPAHEAEGADAMAWFRNSEVVNEGDILTVDGNSYRIIKVLKARRLGETRVQFIKTYLERFDSFVS